MLHQESLAHSRARSEHPGGSAAVAKARLAGALRRDRLTPPANHQHPDHLLAELLRRPLPNANRSNT